MSFRWSIAILMVGSAWAQFAGATAAVEMTNTQTMLGAGGLNAKTVTGIATQAASSSGMSGGIIDADAAGRAKPANSSSAAPVAAAASKLGAGRLILVSSPSRPAATALRGSKVKTANQVEAPVLPGNAAEGIDFRPTRLATITSPGQFWYSEINCSGIATHGKYNQRSRIAGGGDGNLISQLMAGDLVYVTHAKGVQPGSEWRVMRRVHDTSGAEQFPGQSHWLGSIGAIYQPVGRVEIIRVEKDTALANVGFSCEPVEVGDFVIPWHELGGPALPQAESLDVTQGVNGRSGLIVASKGFVSEMGINDEVYLNLGKAQNIKQGQRLLIYRRKSSRSTSALYSVSPVMSVSGVYDSQASSDALVNKAKPPAVIGELRVLWVEPHSSTAVITYAYGAVYPGDEVGYPTK